MKIVFLGTNGWFDTKTGNTICILIETKNEYIILDAGNGLYKADQYIKDDRKPIYLFLSHFHYDHTIGFHLLAKFKFKQGLNICVNKGQIDLLNHVISKDFTLAIDRLPFKVATTEITPGIPYPPILENALILSHPVPCLGFRFNLGGKIICYIADTGPCENSIILAKNSDLLITECAFKVGHAIDVWPHLDPALAANIAKQANVKKLVLVHFDAEEYKTLKERQTAQRQARKIFKNTISAKDGMEVKV